MFGTLTAIVLAPIKLGTSIIEGTAEVIDETLDTD